jgi:hypothetical protein
MSQQLLRIAPQYFLTHLWLEVVQGIEVFQPALRRDEG